MSIRTIIALLILLGAFIAINYDKKQAVAPLPQEVVCPLDTIKCPDNSYVIRSGPQCQFAECPLIVKIMPPKVEFGTVNGVVGLEPACGGPIGIIPDPNCAFKAYETSISFTDSLGKIYKANSGVDGKYSIRLPIGTYKVMAKGGETLPSCPTDAVIVSINKITINNISCESGLR